MKWTEETPMLDRDATLEEVSKFGLACEREFQAVGRTEHAANCAAIVEWASTLRCLPSVYSVGACFRALAKEFAAVRAGKPQGTGAYNLEQN